MSLSGAATGMRRSARFWPALVFIATLTAIDLLTPATGVLWDLVSLVTSLLVGGYLLSVSRTVSEGRTILPPVTEWTPLVRRGLSLGVALLPMIIPFLVLISVLLVVWPSQPQGLIGVLVALLFTAPITIVTAQYIAFDRLREGFRYGRAWAHFRSHSQSGLRLIGFLLLCALLWTVAQTVLTRLGSARLAAEIVAAVLYALVSLIGAHLLGQYVALAYAGEREVGFGLTSAST